MDKHSEYIFPDCFCTYNQLDSKYIYNKPPEVETDFFENGEKYYREVKTCKACGHFVSIPNLEFNELYQGRYVDKKYSNPEGLRHTLEKIAALPPEKSDNTGRVNRIINFTKSYFLENEKEKKISVLDVGSGLCVFLNKLKEYNFDCMALDPDKRAAVQAKKIAGVNAICSDFRKAENIGTYDLITFNKVLEHVKDPIVMLKKAKEFLSSDGSIYIELPDGEMAQKEGQQRQEFAIDHYHVFSVVSLCLFVVRSGFHILSVGRLTEPSGKYTLWAFLNSR